MRRPSLIWPILSARRWALTLTLGAFFGQVVTMRHSLRSCAMAVGGVHSPQSGAAGQNGATIDSHGFPPLRGRRTLMPVHHDRLTAARPKLTWAASYHAGVPLGG